MNEFTRPDDAESPKAGAAQPSQPMSLVERAAREMHGGLFAAPPVPTHLPPAPVPVAGAVAPPVPGPVPAPVPAPVPESVACPEAVAQPAPAPVAPAQPSPETQARAKAFANRPIVKIDRERLAEAGMILPEGEPTAQLEEFRIVKRQLLVQSADLRRRGGGGAAQRVMISSPHPGEGKTFCALNLALSIAAEKDSEVLLVDLDLARHSVLEILDLPHMPGLMDAMADPAIDVHDCVIRTDIPGLSVLPGGKPTMSDAEYLASARAATVLDSLTEGTTRRIVLFDTPPVLAASLPVEVAKLVGQVVMVVMTDKTSTGAIRDAAGLLGGCPNLQLLLNAVHFSPSGRRFGSYYGYKG